MYLRNDPPFSLQHMASQWRDTILSDFPDTSLQLGLAKSFQALVHLHGDSADDLLLWCGGDGRTARFSIFRGNPDFGSHRLTLDSAAFNLWHPSKYDSYFQFAIMGFANVVGDMSGKGIPMLCVQYEGQGDEMYFFYGLGAGLSDRASVFFERSPTDLGYVDSITADGDNLEDVIIGDPSYSNTGNIFNGAGEILILHGSSKIPIANLDVVPAIPMQTDRLEVIPNPVTGPFDLLFLNSDINMYATITIQSILGSAVFQETVPINSDNNASQEIPLNSHTWPSGTYFVTVRTRTQVFHTPLVIDR